MAPSFERELLIRKMATGSMMKSSWFDVTGSARKGVLSLERSGQFITNCEFKLI